MAGLRDRRPLKVPLAQKLKGDLLTNYMTIIINYANMMTII
ncbi:hypothetical protein [Azospirillum endophyticum]